MDTADSDTRPPTSTQDDPEAFVDASRGATAGADIDLEELRERAAADRERDPYSVVEVEQTVGTKPDPDLASSPDVAPDGSIGNDESTNITVPDAETPETFSMNRTAVIVAVVVLAGIIIALLL